ncbi:hypothetical protein V6N13_010201 [Hibiscus sabdariffa]
MSSMAEAERAIERLHDFSLYGSKLSVKLASMVKKERNRFEARSWRYREEKRQKEEWINNLKQVPMVIDTQRMNIDQSILLSRARKRVKGHIDNEELWKMRKCLVGEMKTVCTVSSLNDRLHNWGLGEIGVQRMGAKTFLLTIEDEDLFLLLEDLEWSYLKEIFNDIKPWTETTNKIEEVVELEVGDRVVEVSVVEIGFSEASTVVGNRNMKAGNGSTKDKLKASSSSGSSSVQPQKEATEGG